MKACLLTAFVLSACAHLPVPPTFGFSAHQCVKGRPVVCVADLDMSAAWCAEHVQGAIKTVNAAVGQEMLVYGGVVYLEEEASLAAKEGKVILWTDKLDHQLGITHYIIEANGCVGTTTVTLDVSLQFGGEYTGYAHAVIVHELIHVLGADHATTPSAWRSIMATAPGMQNSADEITEGDLRALWAAYP